MPEARRDPVPGPPPSAPEPRGPASPEWESWDDERLLDVRMCDLGLRIHGSFVEPFLRQVRRELRQRGLRLRPHFWLSDEWFCPDGISGVAIPFYLAHPRLARLEQAQMLEVEGGTPDWCLRILRHEVGHALENAFGLRRRKRRIQLFGRSSEKYPEDYAPRPYSKSFVVHLEAGYAQSHPDEDFAETFAVWLTPGSDWARRYAGWKALRKLEYVDALMREIAGREPRRRGGGEVEPLRALGKTLREHYEPAARVLRRGRAGALRPRPAPPLLRMPPSTREAPSAARFLSRFRKEAGRRVRRFTGSYQYLIDRVLGEMIERCRQLNLRLATPEEQARQDFLVLLAVRVVNDLHTGRLRLAL